MRVTEMVPVEKVSCDICKRPVSGARYTVTTASGEQQDVCTERFEGFRCIDVAKATISFESGDRFFN